MAQAKALDALAPFLALARTSNSPRQTADVISRATSHPGTFVFAELLQTPRVRELASADPEYAAYLTALRIFSYGTYADYTQGRPPAAMSQTSSQAQAQASASAPAPASASASAPAPAALPLPALNEAQQLKLRQLSLISLATSHANLTYDHLIAALSLGDDGNAAPLTDAKLEALVVSAIYAGLIVATLDPACRVVRVSSVAPLRDVAPASLPKLHASLRGWAQRCETTLADLDAQIAGIHRAAAERADAEAKWDATFKRAVEDERKAMLGWRPAGDAAGPGSGPGPGSSPLQSAGSRTMTLNVGGGSQAMRRQQPSQPNQPNQPIQQQQQQPVRMNKRGSSGSALTAELAEDRAAAAAAGKDSVEESHNSNSAGAADDGAMDLDEADGTRAGPSQ